MSSVTRDWLKEIAELCSSNELLRAQLAACEREHNNHTVCNKSIAEWAKKTTVLEQQLAAITPRWTTERPTKVGWYFARHESWPMEKVLYLSQFSLQHQMHLYDHGGHWAGPIPLPEEQP